MADLSAMLGQLSLNIPPHATFNKSVQGLGNIYSFEIKPGNTVVYRYDVELIRKVNGDEKSLTKGGGDDGKKGLLRDICFELVCTTFKANFGDSVNFVYDNRKNLFTDKRINPVSMEIAAEKMSKDTCIFLRNQTVYVTIQPVKDKSHVLNLNDITTSLQRITEEQSDHSLRTFLEMLTSQPFLNAGEHSIVGMGRIFYRHGTKMHGFPAVTTHKGLAKGVRIIENGDKTKPVPALVADVKTCAFFTAGNLRQIADEMIQQKGPRFNRNDRKMMELFWADFGQLFKGVSASLSYAPSRIIVIDSATSRTCQEISIDVEGRSMTLPEYFRVKKNTEIDGRYPAVRQHIDRDSLFPLECLNILPLQRLTIDKMMINEDMGRISRDLLTANATKPDVRYGAIQAEMKKIGDPDGPSAQFMLKFGVKLKGGRNDVQIGMLPLPNMKFGGHEQQQDDRGRFDIRGPTRYQYLQPSQMLQSWVIGYPRRVEEGQFRKFINDILYTAKNRGMVHPQPKYEMIELAQLEFKMEQMQKDKVQFLLYMDNKFIKSHSQLKLFERRFMVLTQHVTIEMAQRAGAASVQNVLNKMNMKLRGLNYLPVPDPVTKAKFDLSSGNVLVIGVDTSRPPRATAHELFMMKKQGMMEGLVSEEPMTVGFCANYAKDPNVFYGDYYYQPCKQDVLDEEFLQRKMVWTFNQIKANRNKPPSTIVIIRDGLSEGMLPNAVKGEFQSFVQSCTKFAAGWMPKFVYIIVDKRHNKRFFVKRGPQQVDNTMPGSVIDRKFVRVDMHEFFLQAHFPLKGCSKIPQYIIPVNQVKANNQELQAFILALCNMWQIVNLAPALPTPVLQAKELAKRGRNNYMELKHNNPRTIPYVPVGDRNGHMIDYVKLNALLNYEGARGLVLTRFNA